MAPRDGLAVVLDRQRFLTEVRRQLDEVRQRTGMRAGEDLDHALVAIEALAALMAAMSDDAAALIAEGERTVGTIVSAALTKAALWRIVVLPAIIGALVSAAIIGLSTTVESIEAQRVIQADHVAWADKVDAARVEDDRRFQGLRADLESQRLQVEADRQRLEATLPSELLKRAETLTGAAREIVRQEAANAGFIDFIGRTGLTAYRAAQLNGGSLCLETVYHGDTPYCEYRAR